MIYKGNPVSAGIAIGSAFVYDPKILTAPEDAPVLPMECELERYENAVQAAQAKLREIQAAFTGKDDDKAEIFSAHLDMVDDEEISEEIRSAIHAGTGAAKAVEQVYQRYADLLAALDDDFMVQRAHDLLDVQQRLLRILLGALEQNLSRLDGPVIVICDDLMPSDTATMDRANVLGIVAQKGGYTSHSAIIARGWGIPAVLGIPDIMSCVSSGDTIVLDAIAGNLHSEPTPQELQNAAAQQTMFMEQMNYCTCADTLPGLKNNAGAYFEKLIGHLYARHLGINPSTQMNAVELDGESISLPTDFIFNLGPGKPKLHIPVKTSTRERVVEVWAQQRILDGAFGVGRFFCLLTCIGETNLGKNMSIDITCVPNQWMNYQLFVAQITRAYYLDMPEKYRELNDRFPKIHVKEFGEYFHESEHLFD